MMKRLAGGWGLQAAAAGAVSFGILTIVAGGSALFGGPEARAAAGNAIPFVLWFNFSAGFLYVLAGAGLFARRKWAAWLAGVILVATLGAFGVFGLYVMNGEAYEMRTVGAMIVRSLVWSVITAIAWKNLLAARPGMESGRWRVYP